MKVINNHGDTTTVEFSTKEWSVIGVEIATNGILADALGYKGPRVSLDGKKLPDSGKLTFPNPIHRVGPSQPTTPPFEASERVTATQADVLAYFSKLTEED
jgi:hypothetical protein